MNRTIIATVTILSVAAVAIFGLRQLTQANAASTITVHDADVNWDGRINSGDQGALASKFNQVVPPSGRPVAEQNLDGNGNIKVAQQGPISVAGTASTVISLLESATVPSNSVPLVSPYVDVSACERLDLFANGTLSAPVPIGVSYVVSFEADASISGQDDDGNLPLAQSTGSGFNLPFGAGEGLTPKSAAMRVRFNEPDVVRAPFAGIRVYATNSPPAATVSAWLVCS